MCTVNVLRGWVKQFTRNCCFEDNEGASQGRFFVRGLVDATVNLSRNVEINSRWNLLGCSVERLLLNNCLCALFSIVVVVVEYISLISCYLKMSINEAIGKSINEAIHHVT